MPVTRVAESCGQGCGRPVYSDGYCAPCWHLARVTGTAPPIDPMPARESCPDVLPSNWTQPNGGH